MPKESQRVRYINFVRLLLVLQLRRRALHNMHDVVDSAEDMLDLILLKTFQTMKATRYFFVRNIAGDCWMF